MFYIHGFFKKKRIQKEMRAVHRSGMEPSNTYREELKTGLSEAEKEMEPAQETFKRWKKNIEEGAEIRHLKKQKKQKVVYQRKNTEPLGHPEESRMHRGYQRQVTFLIPAPPKMFGDSSIPDMSYHHTINAYQPFRPHTLTPHNAPLPPYLQNKRNMQKWKVYIQHLIDNQDWDRLREVYAQFQRR